MNRLVTYPKCLNSNDPTCLGLQITLPAILLWFLIDGTVIIAFLTLIFLIINKIFNKKINLTKYLLSLTVLIAAVIGGYVIMTLGF
jgi:hypothetical protein